MNAYAVFTSELKLQGRLNVVFPLVCFVLACLMSGGCAYKMAGDFPSVLGDGSRTVKIKSVDNPTMSTDIAYILRSRLREEITARHMAKWVDSGPADYSLEIKIKQFSERGETFDDIFKTKLYSIQLVVELIVYDGSTNRKVWESGPISQTDFSEIPKSRRSTMDVAILLVRQMADKMRNQF